MPTLEETQRFFNAIANRYDRVYAPSGETTKARMAEVVRMLPRSSRVLDLGVGTGRELPALLDAQHDVVGLDCSKEMIALCNNRSRTIPIVDADLWLPLPFADASFDVVLSLFGTLAHPPDDGAPARLAREVTRVLRAGGVFLFELPSAAWVNRLGTKSSQNQAIHDDPVARVSLAFTGFDSKIWTTALSEFEVSIDEINESEVRVVAFSRPT